MLLFLLDSDEEYSVSGPHLKQPKDGTTPAIERGLWITWLNYLPSEEGNSGQFHEEKDDLITKHNANQAIISSYLHQ